MAKRRFRERLYFPIPAPVGGLRYDKPTTMLQPEETPKCDEVIFADGVITKAPGASYFASTDSSPLTGTVLKVTWLNDKLVVHTTSKVYWLSSGSFADKTDAGGPYTGDADNRISTVWMNSLYIWANGADNPRKWDLSGNVATLSCGSRTPVWLTYYGARLNFYNVDSVTRRVRWSDLDDPETWTAASYNDLTTELDENDSIQRATRLAHAIIIYGKYSIAKQEYSGEYPNPFIFRGTVPDVGLAAPDALVSLQGREHIFLGWEDVYSYTGQREAIPIGGPIRDQLFEELDAANIQRSFMAYLPEKEVIRLHYPTLGQTEPDAYFEYNLKDRAWSRGSRTYSGWGRYIVEASPTWADLGGTWDSQSRRWDDRSLTQIAPLTLYGNSSGHVFQDGAQRNYGNVAVDGQWDTKDFVEGEGYKRTITNWMELTFEATGHGVTVSYSTDAGLTYTDISTVTLTENWEDYSLHFEVWSEKVRFRFRNSTSNEAFSLRWVEVGYMSGSDRKEDID